MLKETFVSMQEDGGSVVVDSLFIVAPIVCEGILFGPCFVMQYLVSFLVLLIILLRRESWLLVLCVLVVLLVGLKYVIVAFSCHTHFFIIGKWDSNCI